MPNFPIDFNTPQAVEYIDAQKLQEMLNQVIKNDPVYNENKTSLPPPEIEVDFTEVEIEDLPSMIAEIFRLKRMLQAIAQAYSGQEVIGITKEGFEGLLKFIREAKRMPIQAPVKTNPFADYVGVEDVKYLKWSLD